MNAFERGNLATAERELRKAVPELDALVGEESGARRAMMIGRIEARVTWALDEIERAVRISEAA